MNLHQGPEEEPLNSNPQRTTVNCSKKEEVSEMDFVKAIMHPEHYQEMEATAVHMFSAI